MELEPLQISAPDTDLCGGDPKQKAAKGSAEKNDAAAIDRILEPAPLLCHELIISAHWGHHKSPQNGRQ